jgi:NTE family protein
MFRKLANSVRAFTQELKHHQVVEQGAGGRPKIGVALGGGFARGLAHIGVLKVLEEEKIPIDMVAGTSVGSVIGAAYCSGISGRELEEVARVVRFSSIARYSLSRFGICSNDRLGNFLCKILKVGRFEDLKIPLAVTATDFETGDGVVFREGPLQDPVRASCAYPGMFPPVAVNGRLLVDGMLAHVVPTVPLREMGADRVLGIFLSSKWTKRSGPRHVFDIVGQCFSIAQDKMCGLWQGAADLVLTPDVSGFGYDDFALAPALIRAGEEATRAALPQIRSWLESPAPSIAKARKTGEIARVTPAPAMPTSG